jgi:hypothetical protein
MGEGERLHEQRRRRFWLIVASIAVLAVAAGFLSGFAAGVIDARSGEGHSALTIVGAVTVAIMVVGTIYGSWRFFMSVDEVEVTDNLWASLIGFYTYGILFPAWWVLSEIGLVTEPNQWIIYAATLLSGTAACAYRKWQSR